VLEPLKIVFHAATDDPECVGCLLDEVLRVVLHEQGHACSVLDRFEGDGAGVHRLPVETAPNDALIRNLLNDLGVPTALGACDLGGPTQRLRITLQDGLHAVHESREVFELRPLVVCGAHRHFDIDRFLDGGHVFLPWMRLQGNDARTRARQTPDGTSWKT